MIIRPPYADERAYVISSWREAYRFAPGGRNSRWRDYEARVNPMFGAILDRDDTRVLVKVVEDVILGWICFARGKHADTVHWVQTRYRIDPTGAILRERGTMRDLFDAAELKPYIGYTFRGENGTIGENGRFLSRGKGMRVTSDTWIAKWLMRRDVGAAFVDIKEWMMR